MFTASVILRHLLQLKANFTMPTKGDHHHVSVHGIASLLPYSCEPTISKKPLFHTSAIVSQESIFFVGRSIGAKGLLTQAYNLHSVPQFHVSKTDCGSSLSMLVDQCTCGPLPESLRLISLGIADRHKEILANFGTKCQCSRCFAEKTTCYKLERFFFLPLACPRAPECSSTLLVAPSNGNTDFRCAASECPGRLSSEKAREVYHDVTRAILDLPSMLLERNYEEKLPAILSLLMRHIHGQSDFLCSFYIRLAILLGFKGQQTGALKYVSLAISIRETLDEGKDTQVMGNLCCIALNCLSALERQKKKEKEPTGADGAEANDLRVAIKQISQRFERIKGKVDFEQILQALESKEKLIS